jgi:Homeodomain-like domain
MNTARKGPSRPGRHREHRDRGPSRGFVRQCGGVAAWRRRFTDEGLPNIGQPRAGRGRKPRIPAEKIDEIVKLTQNSKPPAEIDWSCRSMVKAAGVSLATVQRV